MEKPNLCLSIPFLWIVLSILPLSSTFSQTESKPTLTDLIGNWEWRYLQVKGKPLTRVTDFYATEMSVEGDQFIMRFSEAACSGTIIRENNALILRPSESDNAHYLYEDAEVLEIEGDRLFILFRKHVWPMFKGTGQVAEVVYCYRKTSSPL